MCLDKKKKKKKMQAYRLFKKLSTPIPTLPQKYILIIYTPNEKKKKNAYQHKV